MDAAGVAIGPIRQALELAWAVAKVGAEARPPVAAPGPMRPLLRVARLPDRMLATIRQAVVDDDEFRQRVVAAATEEDVGRASWLWLVRPDGWEAELEEFVTEAGAAAESAQVKRDERRLQRQLDHLQSELANARADVALLKQANEGLAADAEKHRKAKANAERDRDRIQSALQEALTEKSGLEQSLQSVQRDLDSTAVAVDEAKGALADAQAEASASRVEADLALDEALLARTEANEGADRLQAALAALSVASEAAAELASSTFKAAAAISGRPLSASESDGLADSPVAATPTPARKLRRQPLPLPPATYDDSLEAADHLLRSTGILLIVDGYNVTLSSWPGLDLAEQRKRLLHALAEMTARTGALVRVVFDGTAAGNRVRAPSGAGRRMSVEFTPSEVEADRAIVEHIEALDLNVPVVVATNDKQIRSDTARRGANVISVAQLLGVLRRGPAR